MTVLTLVDLLITIWEFASKRKSLPLSYPEIPLDLQRGKLPDGPFQGTLAATIFRAGTAWDARGTQGTWRPRVGLPREHCIAAAAAT